MGHSPATFLTTALTEGNLVVAKENKAWASSDPELKKKRFRAVLVI